ncbi:50S ribosomal protein L11 methyltransferase [Parabacteroides sp. OttesenSCG-928-J18]|nr:50S ribosomal protein L11 methyltransferase [Parabacteroides sp. OttesenSCG-928-J18]
MNYYELTITYTSSLPKDIIHDILASELGEVGFDSFTETDKGLLAYIKENLYDKEALQNQLRSFPLVDVTFHIEEALIKDRDWNEEWEKNYFKPIRIDQDCLIRASFHEEEPGYTYTIVIDPKMAFGTGNHETTYLMIKEILGIDFAGKEVLDMGCGTAVLAILAAMKGAQKVTAIDIDEWAFKNALENIRLNKREEIDVACGGAELIADYPPFDIIFANINRNILLQDIPTYAQNLKPGGQLYMSGFYREDIPLIEEACKQQGLRLISFTEKNNWVAVKVES